MTKNYYQIAAVLLSALVSASAFAECEYPGRIDIPDGATSDKDTMLDGQRQVKEYVSSMETCLDCIVKEEQNARAEMDNLDAEDEQQREDMLNKKYNAAVEEMEKVAAEFNAEVQAYRAKGE